MTEDSWLAARLIPTSGINGADEQERRATSALLAVMGAVKEFGRALTQPLGAPAGSVQTFIEVPFKLGDAKVFPDGLIRVARGQRAPREGRPTTRVNWLVRQLKNAPDTVRLESFAAYARGSGNAELLGAVR